MALGNLTARDLESAVEKFKKENGPKARRVPKLTRIEAKVSDETRVWIYNVGPWEHFNDLGSTGRWWIPACPTDKEWVTMPRELPGIFTETVPIDEKSFELRRENGTQLGEGVLSDEDNVTASEGGRYMAEQIVGVGPMVNPQNSLIKFGVFIGRKVGWGDRDKTKPPAPHYEELDAAKDKLKKHYQFLVQEAVAAFERGPGMAEATIRPQHITAAKALKLENQPWMARVITGTRKSCPMCGTIVDETVVMCPNHTSAPYIFDMPKYMEIMGNMQAAQAQFQKPFNAK